MPVIWDVHSHLSGVPGTTPEKRADKLLAFADRLGVARLCIFMGMNWFYEPTVAELKQSNDEILRAVAHRPDRLFGFVYLNPQHIEASLDEMNRCIRDGPMVGVKLWVAVRCTDSSLDPIAVRAAELQAPILQHTWSKITGNLPGESTAEDLATLAHRHPAATFILGHSGGDWEPGLRAVRSHSNVFADLGGGDPTAGLTETAVRELGAERVLYGSDAGGRSFASQLAKVVGADVSKTAKEQVLAKNLQRILSPILETKQTGDQPVGDVGFQEKAVRTP